MTSHNKSKEEDIRLRRGGRPQMSYRKRIQNTILYMSLYGVALQIKAAWLCVWPF